MQERKENTLASNSATVSVVVPTYRRPDSLRETLAALAAVEHPREAFEVIVVDDDGGGHAANAASSLDLGALRMRCLEGARGGAAAARNRGASAADGDLLIFCDDDVLVGRDHLERHLEAQRVYPRSLVNGVSEFAPPVLSELETTPFGRFRIALEQGFESEADGRPLGDGRFEAPLISARNLAIARDVFWELGGFDEAYPFAGAEDQDLSLRAREAGLRLVRDHRIRVLNNEPTITLRQFCAREERSARTFAVLVSRFPDQASRPLYADNVAPRGSRRLAAAVKTGLSRRPSLAVVHRAADALERLGLGDRSLRRVYTGLVGLHIFRGVRSRGG